MKLRVRRTRSRQFRVGIPEDRTSQGTVDPAYSARYRSHADSRQRFIYFNETDKRANISLNAGIKNRFYLLSFVLYFIFIHIFSSVLHLKLHFLFIYSSLFLHLFFIQKPRARTSLNQGYATWQQSPFIFGILVLHLVNSIFRSTSRLCLRKKRNVDIK